MDSNGIRNIFLSSYIVGRQELVRLKDKNLYLFPIRITKKADLQQDQPVLNLSIFLNHLGINHRDLRSDICNQLMYLAHTLAGLS
jgi:hypothetical protein